jgi:hypothetical protein
MSSDGEDPPDKPGGAGKVPTTLAGVPMRRAVLPPPNAAQRPAKPSQPPASLLATHRDAVPPPPESKAPAAPTSPAPSSPAPWPLPPPPVAPPPVMSGPVSGMPQLPSGPIPSGPSQYTASGGTHVPPAWVPQPAPTSQFVSFLKISARRAFRLRIEPNEVLPEERIELSTASPPIHDVNLQSFLAWRRSVLFLVACALIPLTVVGIIDSLRSTRWMPIFFVKFAPAFAEGVFCYVCWVQLKNWAHWRKQRRMLFWGWLLFMLTPFVVFLYPLRTVFEGMGRMNRDAMVALGFEGVYQQVLMPFMFAMLAMLQLAPKAISLMPGLVRASLVIKLLFPGVSAPGWLIVMAAPLYALLAYVILIIPYQFTGSGWFIFGVLGIMVGQAVLARAGFGLAKPMDDEEALRYLNKVRKLYLAVMGISGILIIIALGSLVSKLDLRATDVVLAIMKFQTNVLILTMIGADLVVTNLDKARSVTQGRDHVEDATETKIAAFVSFEAPPPPPRGPAG